MKARRPQAVPLEQTPYPAGLPTWNEVLALCGLASMFGGFLVLIGVVK